MIAQLSAFRDAFASGAAISVVNYHNTPLHRADQYDRELKALAKRFAPTSEDDLAAYIKHGHWLTGWFFVPSGYVECPAREQSAFAQQNTLRTIPDEYRDGRYAMSWEELRELDGRHVIASHTRNHAQIAMTDDAALASEIIGSQADFRARLGHPVRAFAWLFGQAYGEVPQADRYINQAGYEFLFSNFRIQRLNPTNADR